MMLFASELLLTFTASYGPLQSETNLSTYDAA